MALLVDLNDQQPTLYPLARRERALFFGILACGGRVQFFDFGQRFGAGLSRFGFLALASPNIRLKRLIETIPGPAQQLNIRYSGVGQGLYIIAGFRWWRAGQGQLRHLPQARIDPDLADRQGLIDPDVARQDDF